MAYQGSTAASSVSNPPVNLVQGLSAGGFSTAVSTSINLGSTQIGSTLFSLPGRAIGNSVWFYASTDGTTTVLGSSYFSDGFKLGMRCGDLLFGVFSSSQNSTTQNFYIGIVGNVSSTSGGADLSTGAFGSAFNFMSSTRASSL